MRYWRTINIQNIATVISNCLIGCNSWMWSLAKLILQTDCLGGTKHDNHILFQMCLWKNVVVSVPYYFPV